MSDENIKDTTDQQNQENGPMPNDDQPSAETLSPEEQTEQKCKELERENMRLRADMENLRKRAHKDKMDFAKYANENLLCEIIPVFDNFERATKVTTEDAELQKFLKGFTMIQDQLEYTLKNAGLEKIEAVNQTFDPNFHEAVEIVETNETESDMVVEVMRTGYIFNDKVIRPALVKVSK